MLITDKLLSAHEIYNFVILVKYNVYRMAKSFYKIIIGLAHILITIITAKAAEKRQIQIRLPHRRTTLNKLNFKKK